MPHKGKGIYGQYDVEALKNAVDAVKSGMSIRKAAIRYGVPKSSLNDRTTGKKPIALEFGRKPTIPIEIEDRMVEVVLTLSEKGFGITKRQMLARVGTLVRQMDLKTPFKNGIPGKDWWKGFKNRHPEVVIRKPEKLSTVRSRMLNATVVGNYFKELQTVTEELSPTSIWNMDETGINLEHQPAGVLARRGAKSVPGRVGNTRENITLLPCVNAAGEKMPTFIVAKGKTSRSLRAYNMHEGPENAEWRFQAKAWMDDELGEDWFKNVFLKHCGPQRPQVLVLDSHHSHETLGLLEAALANRIEVLAFPPHTTHFLCPLDRTIFGPLMKEYGYLCTEYMSSDPNNIVNKESAPKLIRQAYEKAFTRVNIVSGFESTGIYHWNPLAIPKEAFSPSDAFDRNNNGQSKTDEHPLQWVLANIQSVPNNPIPFVSLPTDVTPIAQPENVQQNLEVVVEIHRSAVPSSVHTVAENQGQDGEYTVDFESPNNSILNTSNDPMISQSLSDLDAANILAALNDGNMEITAGETVESSLHQDITGWSSQWNSELENIFKLPPIIPKPPKKNSRRLTSHRLLTSPQILNEKRKAKQEKDDKCKKLKAKKDEKCNNLKVKKEKKK
ncbi:jerky protein homolog [Mytilus edulis]|uniref:jerky protein homolog n=1 Tax=Mytilus edulis TaxID=6550 RepID=UPI0039F0F123